LSGCRSRKTKGRKVTAPQSLSHASVSPGIDADTFETGDKNSFLSHSLHTHPEVRKERKRERGRMNTANKRLFEKRHVSVRFPLSNFKFFELSFQSSIATFPRGTCSLSGFRLGYLALDGIYHPCSGCDAKQPYSWK